MSTQVRMCRTFQRVSVDSKQLLGGWRSGDDRAGDRM